MRRRFLLAAPALAAPPFQARPQGAAPPLRLVLAAAPGGVVEALAGLLGPELVRRTGRSLAAEMAGDAAAVTAAARVAGSAPDGGTLLLAEARALAAAPALLPAAPVDARRDLAPVARLVEAPLLLAAHPALPAAEAAALPALARAAPQRLAFAHAGALSPGRLAALRLAAHWGVALPPRRFAGTAAALAAVAEGGAALILEDARAAAPACREGRLRPLAVSGPRGLPDFPGLPLFRDLGWGAAEANPVLAVLAPRATPAAEIAGLAAAFLAALGEPEVAQELAALGAAPLAEGPGSFRAWLAAEAAAWARFVAARPPGTD